METANDGTVVVAQVEHIDGVRAIGSILGVSGVDAVFIGPYDLSASLDKPGRIQDPDVREAVASVAAACAARKVPVGIFTAGIPGAVQALGEGYTLVCAGIDIGLFSQATGEIVRALRPRNP